MAAGGVEEIGAGVERIREISPTTSAAAEQQTAMATEISRGTAAVAGSAASTSQVTEESAAGSGSLAGMAASLPGAVAQFQLTTR